MSKSVFCLSDNEFQTEKIVQQLKDGGFSNNDISVLFPDKSGTKDFAHEQHTKAPEGAATGAGTGGALGGALGWLVGYWGLGHSRRRTIYSCGTDRGRSGWRGCRCRRRRVNRGASGHGHP